MEERNAARCIQGERNREELFEERERERKEKNGMERERVIVVIK